MNQKTFTIIDEMGLHARPASALVSAANDYSSDIKIVYKGKNVNLKSILGVMSMGIPSGEEFDITAEGADQDAAMEGLEKKLKSEGLIA